ncbi:sugar phosphate isomerase/epimerase [Candidatus Bipolaricaulota bacterium]|nr:sugar phosphate isomerase/epimerase [Candidatus Bipolaricaulota bacterium]
MDRKRLALSTFLLPGMDLWRWLALAADLGLGGVELRADPGMAHADDLGPVDRRRLREAARDAGLWLTVHVPIYGVNLVSPIRSLAAASLAEAVATVDLAADLGAGLVVVHPGGIPEDYAALDGEYERAWRRFMFALALLVPHAGRRGVRTALENKQQGRDRDLVLTLEEHVRALAPFPELGACLDFGHLHTVGGDPRAFVAALGNRLIHVHLHDNHGQGDEHLPLGHGDAPWAEALAALSDHGYTGCVVLEIPDQAGLRESAAAVIGA